MREGGKEGREPLCVACVAELGDFHYFWRIAFIFRPVSIWIYVLWN